MHTKTNCGLVVSFLRTPDLPRMRTALFPHIRPGLLCQQLLRRRGDSGTLGRKVEKRPCAALEEFRRGRRFEPDSLLMYSACVTS